MRICRVHVVIVCLVFATTNTYAQKFVHPGINQNARDLEEMKRLVTQGQQPYKDAFARLKAVVDTSFKAVAHTHVLRGPYGRPNIGGNELSRSAEMAYNYAIAWYITNDKLYANKAIEILNTWSPVLWHFDYNDAKLLAAWTGHLFCNAAEILRYTNSGWQQSDIEKFANMLMTAYYPLFRYYYPQANGNWDGAIIHSILAIAVFTDNRKMFDNAIDHYLHAPVNGSIFKYIYPSGQCQETMRDQAHVQLGLGEFAGAAQIAYTQGVDLYTIADNRLGLGYEYTASFLLGQTPHSYGKISERAKNLRDDYESVYRQYAALGVDLPYTKRAADSIRSKANRSVLTSVRAPINNSRKTISVKPSSIGYIAGASTEVPASPPSNAIIVYPGDSIQGALDAAAGSGRWVILKAGVHTIRTTLRMPSSVTLAGEGLRTILFMEPGSSSRDIIVNSDNEMHDVTIRDMLIEGNTRVEPPSDPNSNRSYRGGYNRGGIIFRALKDGQMKNINLINLTVQSCTYNGVFISGAGNVNVLRCDFNENGGSVVPGPRLQHNLLLTHCIGVTVKDSRLDTSPFGSGLAIDHCNNVSVTNSEIARNGFYGVVIAESTNVTLTGNLVEGNDRSGIMVEYHSRGSEKITVNNNIIHYNNGYGVESYAVAEAKIENNRYAGNGRVKEQQKVSNEKYILME